MSCELVGIYPKKSWRRTYAFYNFPSRIHWNVNNKNSQFAYFTWFFFSAIHSLSPDPIFHSRFFFLLCENRLNGWDPSQWNENMYRMCTRAPIRRISTNEILFMGPLCVRVRVRVPHKRKPLILKIQKLFKFLILTLKICKESTILLFGCVVLWF